MPGRYEHQPESPTSRRHPHTGCFANRSRSGQRLHGPLRGITFRRREVVPTAHPLKLGPSVRTTRTSSAAGRFFAASARRRIVIYSTARIPARSSTSRRCSAALTSCARHSMLAPPASAISSATHSNCSCVRASAGKATSPSHSCATPNRRSFRHTAIRGVDGSRGIRYDKSTQNSRSDETTVTFCENCRSCQLIPSCRLTEGG